VLDFYFLAGDATGDMKVDLDDFNVLATNFGTLGHTFSEGDFDYDGDVDLDDFDLLAGNFGTDLNARAASTSAGHSRAAATTIVQPVRFARAARFGDSLIATRLQESSENDVLI